MVLAAFSVLLIAGGLGACRKESEKKTKTEKKTKQARPRGGKPARPEQRTSPGAAMMSSKQFTEKFKLPAEADAVVYLSLKALRKQDLWKKLSPLMARTQPAMLVAEHCKLDVTKLVDEAAAALSYQSRDSLTIVTGANLDVAKVATCLRKASTNSKLKETIKVREVGGAVGGAGGEQARKGSGAKKKAARKGTAKGARKGTAKGAAKGAAKSAAKGAAKGKAQPKDAPAGASQGPWRVELATDEGTVTFRLTKLGAHKMAISSGRWMGLAAELEAGKKPAITAESHVSKLHRSLVPANIFWAASLGLPPGLKLAKLAAVRQTRSVGAALEGRADSAVVKLHVDMREHKNAASLAQLLKTQLPGLSNFVPALSALSEIIKKIQIKAEGPVLKLSLEVTEKDMQKIQGILQAALRSGMLEARPR